MDFLPVDMDLLLGHLLKLLAAFLLTLPVAWNREKAAQAMGLRTETVYKVPKPADGAAPKYIVSNYANALKSIGGELLQDPAKSSLGDRLTGRVNVDGRTVWVHVTSDSGVAGGNWSSYKLVVLQEDVVL